MIYTVYTGKEPVGELTIEHCGLYYRLQGKIIPKGVVQRLYGIQGKSSVSLGIPNENGEFERRIARSSLILPERVILSEEKPEGWRPWSGEYFGPMVYDGFLRKTDLGWSLALDPDEWEEIPQWREIGKREKVGRRTMIRVDLGIDGQPPLREKENGGEIYEDFTQNVGDTLDPLLLADLPADYDYGGTGTEEAHSHYL